MNDIAWSPRIGDIICVADKRRFCFSTFTRIFTPGGRRFKLAHLKNAFNIGYCIHVAQVAQNDNKRRAFGKFKLRPWETFVKDTNARGLVPERLNTYLDPTGNRSVLAFIRLRMYEHDHVAADFTHRTLFELSNEYPRRKKWYDFRGILADYVPGFRRLRNDPTLKYCSERVRDDLATSGADIPAGPISPQDIFVWGIEHGWAFIL